MQRILLTEEIHANGMSYLHSRFEVEIAPSPAEETLAAHVGEKDALIVRSSPISKKVIEKGKNLKVIGRHGAGVDNIDISAASKSGILVVNTPEANCTSVAEHTVAVMLCLCKKLLSADHALRSGMFNRSGSLPGLVTKLGFTSLELKKKKLAIVGMGRIGQMVAQKCIQGFHMQVLGFDTYTSADEMRAIGVKPCQSLDEIFQEGDFVSIHVPLTAETKGMIGHSELAQMKPSAFLINTSRGGIVNEPSLFEALREERLAGVAVDVFDDEPPNDNHPFFSLENVLVTPHMAAMSDGALLRMAEDVTRGVCDALRGRKPRYMVNPEVWGPAHILGTHTRLDS